MKVCHFRFRSFLIFSFILILFFFLGSCGDARNITSTVHPYFLTPREFSVGFAYNDSTGTAILKTDGEGGFYLKITSEGALYGLEERAYDGFVTLSLHGISFSLPACEDDILFTVAQVFTELSRFKYRLSDGDTFLLDGSDKTRFNFSSPDYDISLLVYTINGSPFSLECNYLGNTLRLFFY